MLASLSLDFGFHQKLNLEVFLRFLLKFDSFLEIGFLKRHVQLVSHPQLKISADPKPGVFHFEVFFFGILKRSANKMVVIGEQVNEVLLNGEPVQVSKPVTRFK